MGCRVPVVSSNAGGLVEVVADGVTGLVVEKGDHLVLADAINNLLMDPEKMKQMGAAGRARVEEKFGWDRTARRFYGLFSGHESAGS
jgi:glycosyltransferase involved in cell wall biosynthesis